MGYRSTVQFIFYPEKDEDFPVMKLWLDENMPGTTKDEDGYCLLDKYVYDGHFPYIQYGAEDVKWYQGYSEVAMVEEAIDQFNELFCAEDSHTPCNYEYVRIGEETEDIEMRFSDDCKWRMHVRREIMVD